MNPERDEVLFESRFLSLYRRDGWYEYIHNTKGKGSGVMVLIYDLSNAEEPKILGRYEHTPSHESGYTPEGKITEDRLVYLTSITGQMDKVGKTHAEVALEEVYEEAGIYAELDELEYLGDVYPSKASDTKIKMFALNGHGKFMGPVGGDGSAGERGSFAMWETARLVIEQSNCPMVGMAYSKLLFNKNLM